MCVSLRLQYDELQVTRVQVLLSKYAAAKFSACSSYWENVVHIYNQDCLRQSDGYLVTIFGPSSIMGYICKLGHL